MLREDKRADFVPAGLFGRKRRFTSGGLSAPLAVSRRRLRRMQERSSSEPVLLYESETESWWLVEGRVFCEDEGLDARDVLALVEERKRRRRRQLDRAHSALQRERTANGAQRTAIPRDVKLAVWERDGGRCTDCGSEKLLEFDHVIPLAMGGSNNERNLQILCADCNRRKGDSL